MKNEEEILSESENKSTILKIRALFMLTPSDDILWKMVEVAVLPIDVAKKTRINTKNKKCWIDVARLFLRSVHLEVFRNDDSTSAAFETIQNKIVSLTEKIKCLWQTFDDGCNYNIKSDVKDIFECIHSYAEEDVAYLRQTLSFFEDLIFVAHRLNVKFGKNILDWAMSLFLQKSRSCQAIGWPVILSYLLKIRIYLLSIHWENIYVWLSIIIPKVSGKLKLYKCAPNIIGKYLNKRSMF